jgi:hypothetical protein
MKVELPEAVRASGLRRADVVDPARQETALTRYFTELIVRELPLGPTLAPADLEYLAVWMARDPLLREKALQYLEGILD